MYDGVERRMAEQHEVAKHVVDAAAIPGGIVGILSHYLGLFNEILTFFVLLTTVIWTVYRIIDIRTNRRKRK